MKCWFFLIINYCVVLGFVKTDHLDDFAGFLMVEDDETLGHDEMRAFDVIETKPDLERCDWSDLVPPCSYWLILRTYWNIVETYKIVRLSLYSFLSTQPRNSSFYKK